MIQQVLESLLSLLSEADMYATKHEGMSEAELKFVGLWNLLL